MPRIVHFGVFQADLESGELFKDGIKLKLGGQPFQVLELLLSKPGEVVTRDELRAAVWQADSFGDFDHGLNTAINKIREALGDSATNPRFVETVPRRGYRFIAPVNQPVPALPAVKLPFPKRMVEVVAGVAIVLGLGFVLSRPRPAPAPVEYKLTQVTRDSGLTHQPSISADGNFVVYSSDRATGKDLDIWIQHVSGGQPVRLTFTPRAEAYPSLSADGRKVAFWVTGQDAGVYVVPALGGTPKMVAPAGVNPQISPDGKTVAYATGWYSTASEIRTVSSEGGPPQTVSTGLEWATSPLFTPDGRQLVVWSGPGRKDTREGYDYWMVPFAGGRAVQTGISDRLLRSGVQTVLDGGFSLFRLPVSGTGGGGLVLSALSGDGSDLWLCPLSEGKATLAPTRVTVGAGAANPSISANGRIAFSRVSVNSGLWMLPVEASTGHVKGEMRRVWTENVSLTFPNASREGDKLAYVSNRGGDPDVWVRDLGTGVDRQLTASKSDELRAAISPDGTRVAFGVQGDFYTMPTSGGVETLVCKGCGPNVVAWSPDGRKLLYYYGKPIRYATFDLATKQKQDVVWHPTADIHNGRISPDGKWITFTSVAGENRVVYIAPLGGSQAGKPESWIPIAEGPRNSFWSPDGNLLYFHFLELEELLARKLHPETKTPSGAPFLVHRFQASRHKPWFSANGIAKGELYFSMQEYTSNIWLADPVGK